VDIGWLPLAAFILTALGWISREIWRWRKAKRLATEDATKTLNQKKTLLEEMLSKIEDVNDKKNLLAQLEEANAALLGLYAQRLRRTLKDAGLPPEEALIADGRSHLQPQQVNNLKKIIAEVKSLPAFPPTKDFLVLGDAYYYTEQYQDAKNVYDKILNSNPDDPHILHNRGKIYASMGKHIEALADLNRSLEFGPDDPYTLNSRGATYHNLKKYKEALADYNRALELKPNDALTLSNRGATYKRLEEYDKALADLNLSLKLRPDFYPAITNRGSIYEHLKNYDKAICDYTHALEVEPDDPPTLYDLARLFSIQGKAKDAHDFLRRVIDKDKRFCQVAKTNRDFDNIREDPRFKKLIESD